VSGTGCAFPLLVLKFPKLRIPASFLFGTKHFGTGVLIATAFVHLLPTAFTSLGNPCLSSFWTTEYEAMPGAIMLASIFFVTIIEMVFSPARHVCGGNEGVAAVSRRPEEPTEKATVEPPCPQEPMRRTESDASMRVRNIGVVNGRVGSISRTLSRYREGAQRLDTVESIRSESENPAVGDKAASEEYAVEETKESEEQDQESGGHNSVLSPEQAHKKAIMQVFLLEMGILFHSVFIGMSLAVTVGNDFTVLLIAIVFHRKPPSQHNNDVELNLLTLIRNLRGPCPRCSHRRHQMETPFSTALAHGSRIRLHVSPLPFLFYPSPLYFPFFPHSLNPSSTPAGMAIGIATHTLYSPNSEVGLLVVGIMNAVSAGFLVFASLIELMSEDFLSDESWQVLRGKRRVYACLLVFAGAFLMSLVGAWA
jgi:zinc transporter 1/2/3